MIEGLDLLFLEINSLEESVAFYEGVLGMQVESINAKIVVVDSFRTVVRKAQSEAAAGSSSEMELQGFVQRLALHLTSWQATTFLIGEYVEGELRDNAHRLASTRAAERFLGYMTSQRRAMTGESGAHTNRPELVAEFGYDCKFAMHALRLGVQAPYSSRTRQ